MKKLFLAAGVLILLGAVIFIIALSCHGWDFKMLDTSKYESHTYEINDTFDVINVYSNTADFKILPSEDGVSKVICFEPNYANSTVSVTDGKLEINTVYKIKWYKSLFNFNSPKVTVYLTETDYAAFNTKTDTGDVELSEHFSFGSIDIESDTGDVLIRAFSGETRVKTDTGDIKIENTEVKSLDLSVSTGDVTLSDVAVEENIKISVSTGKTRITNATCHSFISEGDTGDLILKNLIANVKFDIERDTGDVTFEGCDASEIFVETDTGDVEGSLLTDKVIFASSDTGDVTVPKLLTGGKCEIKSDTGDIKIEIQSKE